LAGEASPTTSLALRWANEVTSLASPKIKK
jgi:hypothetical protein